MPLQMQLSPLWAGLAVYSSKIINDKKEVPEYTSGISFFAVICCKKSLFQGSVQYLTVIPGLWCAEGLAAEELEIRLVEVGHGEFPCAQGLILEFQLAVGGVVACLLYTSPSPRD